MKRIRVVGLLAGILLVVAACEPPSRELLPTQPELTLADNTLMSAEAVGADPFCVLKCTKCLPPNAAACEFHCVYIGSCRFTPLAVDRNGNGKVCSATEGGQGPFTDDVWPQPAVLRMRPEVVDPCPSPAFPHWVEVKVED
jgi:hypothetical protein